MDFVEKALVRLNHWIAHNESHQDEYEKLAAQLETTLHVITQADIDNDQVRQAPLQCRQRRFPVAVTGNAVAVSFECIFVVVADRGFVFDDRDVSRHMTSQGI